MAEWPRRYHPARYDNTQYLVDWDVTVEGWQLRPDTWRELAVWCDGLRFLASAGNQALQVHGQVAQLGDFVMRNQDGVFHVEPADGFTQRWAPA